MRGRARRRYLDVGQGFLLLTAFLLSTGGEHLLELEVSLLCVVAETVTSPVNEVLL